MAHSTATGDKNTQFIGEERASHRNPSLCRYRYGIDNRRELAHRSDPAQIFAAVTEQTGRKPSSMPNIPLENPARLRQLAAWYRCWKPVESPGEANGGVGSPAGVKSASIR